MKPINLNQKRKERQRAEKKSRADANAVKFGRSKAEKLGETTQLRGQERHLNQHKRDDAD